MIIQLSKSTRAFTCNSCVQIKFPLVFDKLHNEINGIIGKLDGHVMPQSPTCALSPLSPLLPPAPHIPISPSTPSAPHPPLSFHPTSPSPSTCPTDSISPNSSSYHSSSNKSTRYEKKALVALIHLLQCASSSLRVVIKDIPRVTPVSMHILIFP